MEIAKEILKQLGGNRFIAMTGAKVYFDGDTLVVKFRGSKVANIMYITLNSKDLYDIKIFKFKGMDMRTVDEQQDFYSDMLVPHFEKITGLYTHL